MPNENSVFEKNYQKYLEQLQEISFSSIATKIGARIDGKDLIVSLYKSDYRISADTIRGPEGQKPRYDICVILSKYLLMCPDQKPPEKDWLTYRNFKDSGPLIHYFSNEIEGALATAFSGRMTDLKNAARSLGGYPPALDVTYDYCVQFDALPRIPVILLFNDCDEEFPAQCSLLFERRVEHYLDPECITMVGGLLVGHLKKALNRGQGDITNA